MTTRTRPRRTALVASLGAAALLALAGCAGSSGDSDSGGGVASAGDAPAARPAAAERVATDAAFASEADAMQGLDPDADAASGNGSTIRQSVISTGSVSLESEDVAKAVFDVQAVIDEHGGTTAQEKTETDTDGRAVRSRMVFRVPVAEFEDTVTALKGIATATSSSTDSEDVTTQVIDTDVRVRAQEKSIERIEVLYARAQSIRDIMAIESQLQRRQAELDSLKQQQAWLADQTSLSTITVHVQTPPPAAKKKAHRDDGFAAGLATGWHALKKVVVRASTGLGAVLPFAVVALVLGVPLWLLLRTRLRRTPVISDTPEPAA